MSLSLQESGEIQGFTVDLPSSLFMMEKEREEVVEHRVLLMDISRQTMFQVNGMVGCAWYWAAGLPPDQGAGAHWEKVLQR